MYLLDTNTLIYFFKGMGNVARVLLSKSPQDLAIPAIVLFELELGIAKSVDTSKRRAQLESFVCRINVLPFGENEAQVAAIIRANLEAKGTPIGPYDTLIAATAVCANATLVTHNTKEFERVQGIYLEDWY